MKKLKSSISKARSYAQLGEYWDKHDLSDMWGKTKKMKFEVVAEPEATYYPVERDLSARIQYCSAFAVSAACSSTSLRGALNLLIFATASLPT